VIGRQGIHFINLRTLEILSTRKGAYKNLINHHYLFEEEMGDSENYQELSESQISDNAS
jgi:hypothetical protein